MNISGSHLNSPPLPELSFDDFLDDPTPEDASGDQHMVVEALDTSQDEDSDGGTFQPNDSLNTPQFKRSSVQIIEDKRLSGGSGGSGRVIKNHAIQVVTAGGQSITKPQITDVKLLNNIKPIGNQEPVRISNTNVGTPRNIGGVTMTQIKTADGRVLYLQKATPGAAATATAAGKTLAKSGTATIRRLVSPAGIQKAAVLSKGVTVASSGLVKAAVPSSSPSPITIKGVIPISKAGAQTSPTKIQVVTTADGKVIKLNPSGGISSPIVLNTKAGTGVTAASSPSNVVLSKAPSQVIIKSNPASTPGKMLVQSSTGKQIVVSSKNIIKLSPKPPVASQTSQITSSSSGLHPIQLSGKTGVQYLRVVTTPSTSKKIPAAPSPATPLGSTSKIVMRTMGGSIVPLPSMQTLVSKRVPSNSSSLEAQRIHRLGDVKSSIAAGDSVSGEGKESVGPEAKKPRFGSTPGIPPPNKIYNLVKSTSANGGVKYTICKKGTTPLRRGFTGIVDPKLRRSLTPALATTSKPLTVSQQQVKHMQVQAQAKQKIRQQQQQIQQKYPQPPAKPLFDILKPPATGTAGSTVPLDALSGLPSRRKHCNCSKSQCLKLYCDCFANGEFCQDCTCKDCYNNLDYEVERERAIRSCLDRNPSAFKPKITAPASGDMRLHNKGCNCKRSGCLKNYCECYEAKIPCSSMCKCVGCRNMEDRPDVDMDSLDGLTAVRDVNKTKEALGGKQPNDIRPNLYLTDDVIEATIMCMVSRIVMHEKQNIPIEDTEREVMEELGESLNQIIKYFGKEKNETSTQLDESKAAA